METTGSAEALHNWSDQLKLNSSTTQSNAWVADKFITADILFLSVQTIYHLSSLPIARIVAVAVVTKGGR